MREGHAVRFDPEGRVSGITVGLLDQMPVPSSGTIRVPSTTADGPSASKSSKHGSSRLVRRCGRSNFTQPHLDQRPARALRGLSAVTSALEASTTGRTGAGREAAAARSDHGWEARRLTCVTAKTDPVDGREGVSGSSPDEGSWGGPAEAGFLFGRRRWRWARKCFVGRIWAAYDS
jgi:hypothetical protein